MDTLVVADARRANVRTSTVQDDLRVKVMSDDGEDGQGWSWTMCLFSGSRSPFERL